MSGTECPRSFLLWSSLALAGAMCGHRVWVKCGDYFSIYPNLYVCLVGSPGSGKSVARNKVNKLIHEIWPEYPTSADIQSHQHICRMMASAEGVFTWKNGSGQIEAARPFFALPDELQNFLATDKSGMMGFLVGVHSSEGFATGFKREENLPQYIENPYFSLLSCAVPEWFMTTLKMDLFSGGAGRRFILVYDRKTKLHPWPTHPPGATEAFMRVVNHLKCLKEFHGSLTLDAQALVWWEKWYLAKDTWPNREDPIVGQFHETKPDMVLRVASLLCLNETPFQTVIQEDHLRAALLMLDALEPGVIRLTSGIGRNPLAGAGAELLEKLLVCGGMQFEKRFRVQFYRNLRDEQWEEMLKHFTETDQLIRTNILDDGGVTRNVLFLPEEYYSRFKWLCGTCKRRYHKVTTCCGQPTTEATPPQTKVTPSVPPLT